MYGHAEALASFERALALLEQEASNLIRPGELAANQRLQIEALYERGSVYRLQGEMRAFVRDLEQEARLVIELGETRALAHLFQRRAQAYRWFCRYREARDAAQEGLRLSQEVGDVSLEALYWRELGLAARDAGDYDAAQAALGNALALAREMGDSAGVLHSLGSLPSVHLVRGEYETSAALAREALTLCGQMGQAFLRRIPQAILGATAAGLGDKDLAHRCLAESLSIARKVSDRSQGIFCLFADAEMTLRVTAFQREAHASRLAHHARRDDRSRFKDQLRLAVRRLRWSLPDVTCTVSCWLGRPQVQCC